MDIKELRKIGLTEGEIKIYDALLELGETTRTKLAKKSGVSPSKVYDVANRLLEKGIISSVKKQGVIHFSAADPERLNAFVEQKQNEIIEEQKIVDLIMPTLKLKYGQVKDKTDIEVFYGWEGMKTVYDDMYNALGKGDTDYVFGASQGLDSKQADIFFNRYYERKRKKGFATKIIFNEEVRKNLVRTGIFYEKPNEVRFLHQETFSEINFYKDTVLNVMLFKKPIVIRIRNKEAADAYKKFFDTLWEQAKK